VHSVELDVKNHKAVVKEMSMDPNKLLEYLHRKTINYMEIIPQKKDGDN
jgi:hypothetical protein